MLKILSLLTLTACGVSSSGGNRVKINPQDINYVRDTRGNCYAYAGIVSNNFFDANVKGIGLASVDCKKVGL